MTVLLMLWLTLLGSAILSSLIGGRVPPASATPVFLVSSVFLAATLAVWRIYLFLPSDVVRVLVKRGVELQRVGGRGIRGRKGKIWVLIDFDHPLGFSPFAWLSHRRRKMKDQEHSLEPSHLPGSSSLNFVNRGPLTELPSMKLLVSCHGIRSSSKQNLKAGDFDRALREAAATMKDEDEVAIIEIRDEWLLIQAQGGTWMGAAFGDRVLKTLDLAEKLVAVLRPSVEGAPQEEGTLDHIEDRLNLRRSRGWRRLGR